MFDGQMSIEKFHDWLSAIEAFLDSTYVLEAKKVKVVAYWFKGGTSTCGSS